VRYAEGGERVTKVILPETLYLEFLDEGGMATMMRTLGVEVVEGKVPEPKFYTGEIK
jgi:hypothetical protein